jgi:RHS repeat-associated protein
VQRGRRVSALRLAARDGQALAAPPPAGATEVFHYHLDHLGTPREMTDARGRIVWSARYRAWGALAVADVDEVDNPLRFQGQYHDAETGLHYNFQRYYDPRTGRFVTQDPIGLQGGTALYRYAANPVEWVDPWGLVCTHEASDAGEAYSAIQSKWGRTPSASDMRELDATISRAQLNDRSAYPLKDGSPFENSPAISPNSQRLNTSGSYEEWTVKTPGVGNRGARRLVLDRPNQTAYYSDDHYESFIDVSKWVFP